MRLEELMRPVSFSDSYRTHGAGGIDSVVPVNVLEVSVLVEEDLLMRKSDHIRPKCSPWEHVPGNLQHPTVLEPLSILFVTSHCL